MSPAKDAVPPTFDPRSTAPRPSEEGARVVAARPTRPTPPARPAPARDHEHAPIPVPGRSDRVSSPAARPQPPARPPARGAAAPTARAAAPVRPGPAASVHPEPAGADPAAVRPGTVRAPRRRHPVRRVVLTLVLLLVLALVWPVGLVVWANGKVQHTAALSGAAPTGGTTYLITGSDARGDGGIAADGTSGARTDTILLLHVPASGPTSLISLPRDSYVPIPGHGKTKLNAAFSYGGAPLLVRTVEQLTGLTIDHYAQIGMGGVKEVVDAVGGVHLCWDADVNDADSGMVWTKGCHDVDGTQALAFSRMRKADPTGDIGRGRRQRQLVSAVLAKIDPASLVWHPGTQVSLIDAGTGALTLDSGSDVVTLARMALAFRAADGPGGVTGTPPIKSLNYRPGGVGSTVLLDPDKSAAFWAQVRDGRLAPGTVGGTG